MQEPNQEGGRELGWALGQARDALGPNHLACKLTADFWEGDATEQFSQKKRVFQ